MIALREISPTTNRLAVIDFEPVTYEDERLLDNESAYRYIAALATGLKPYSGKSAFHRTFDAREEMRYGQINRGKELLLLQTKRDAVRALTGDGFGAEPNANYNLESALLLDELQLFKDIPVLDRQLERRHEPFDIV